MALALVVIVVSLGAGLLQLSTSVTRRQSSEVESMRAFYLAEAGLAEAFQAVRIGRSGQLGSEAAPATFGNGLIWVDALETADGQVRLESTGLFGGGRATLALVVEPSEVPLGFFSDEDLVVDSVLMVDGFNSDEETYEGQVLGDQVVVDRSDWTLNDDPENQLLFSEGTFYRYYAADGDTYYYDHSITTKELSVHPHYGDGTEYDIDSDDFVDFDEEFDDEDEFVQNDDFRDQEYDGVLHYFSTVPEPEPLLAALESGATGPTTGDGGLLSSNGDIVFSMPSGEPVEVYGDVIPGPRGSVDGLADVTVLGETEARAFEIELPEVQVPATTRSAPVRHEGLLPLLVSPGTSGFERIEVAADSELVLRGPATVVIGELILEPGALLTLDTRDGPVELYVTGELDLQVGSEVGTSSDLPAEVSVQVSSDALAPPVQLGATSQFHGTVYAPQAEVRVGSDFEVYGGIVARKLELGAGARLHFDDAGFEGSPIPRIVAWRIIELPAAVRSRRQSPLELLGLQNVALAPLAEAHVLDGVTLTVTFLNHAGAECEFTGAEELFDWDQVAEVLTVERDAQRTREDDCDGDTDTDEDEDEDEDGDLPSGVRDEVQSLCDTTASTGFFAGGAIFCSIMSDHVPLSVEEWAAIDAIPGDMTADNRQTLIDADLAAGGTGGS